MVPASVAVQGIGYGPQAVATQGFFSGALYLVNADFSATATLGVTTQMMYTEAQEFTATGTLDVIYNIIYGPGPGGSNANGWRRFFQYLRRRF